MAPGWRNAAALGRGQRRGDEVSGAKEDQAALVRALDLPLRPPEPGATPATCARPGQRECARAPATRRTVLLSIAKPMPGASLAPICGSRAARVGMPTTAPDRSTSAPPELPGLIAALVWMADERVAPLPSGTLRLTAETMPSVTLERSPSGSRRRRVGRSGRRARARAASGSASSWRSLRPRRRPRCSGASRWPTGTGRRRSTCC